MIIALANQKGGVAKTTSTICLGGLLALQTNCLLVDLDPQGNLTTGLGIEVADDQMSAYEVLTEQAEAPSVIIQMSSGLSLLPSDISLAKAETEILSKVGNFLILNLLNKSGCTRWDKLGNRQTFFLSECAQTFSLCIGGQRFFSNQSW